MSFFNWFSGKSGHDKSDGNEDSGGSLRDGQSRPGSREKTHHIAGQKIAVDPTYRGEERKVKRHARREQLYIAVREAMTRSGVLSATYKFKVLSLDQRGDEFLVMMDIDQSFVTQVEKLPEIEASIVQTARARFEILVTSVYWRIDAHAAVGRPKDTEHEPGRVATQPPGSQAGSPPKKPGGQRYEPIQADEVAAFKQALAAASAKSPVPTEKNVKHKSGPRSYTLLTGFEDTEMPESPTMPALSSTQYGDLN